MLSTSVSHHIMESWDTSRLRSLAHASLSHSHWKDTNTETNNAVETARVIVSIPTNAQNIADVLDTLHGMIPVCALGAYIPSRGKPVHRQHGIQIATALNSRYECFNYEYVAVLVVKLLLL